MRRRQDGRTGRLPAPGPALSAGELAGAEPSASLLWAACRVDPDVDAVRRAVDGGADPAVVVPAALANCLGPMLWRALGAADRRAALGGAGQLLRRSADVCRLQARLLLPRAVALAVGPLVGAGLEPVVLKGPWVAQRYPEPGLRPMGDIDLLLPAGAHRSALGHLAGAGWELVRPRTVDHYDAVLRHPSVPDLSLELHARQEVPHRRVTRVDAGRLWDRRVPMTVAGTAAFVLPPEEELAALARHAGKPGHGFRRLSWIADLAMAAGGWAALGRPVDWDRVRALAHAWRCTTVVEVALQLAARTGLPVPPGGAGLPQGGWRGGALAPLLDPGWPIDNGAAEEWVLRYALTDMPAARLRLLVGSRYLVSDGSVLRWALDVPGETARRTRRLLAATRG